MRAERPWWEIHTAPEGRLDGLATAALAAALLAAPRAFSDGDLAEIRARLDAGSKGPEVLRLEAAIAAEIRRRRVAFG